MGPGFMRWCESHPTLGATTAGELLPHHDARDSLGHTPVLPHAVMSLTERSFCPCPPTSCWRLRRCLRLA